MMQGTQSWCSVMTLRVGMRREVEGQLKTAEGGGICIPMANSC